MQFCYQVAGIQEPARAQTLRKHNCPAVQLYRMMKTTGYVNYQFGQFGQSLNLDWEYCILTQYYDPVNMEEHEQDFRLMKIWNLVRIVSSKRNSWETFLELDVFSITFLEETIYKFI